MKVVDLIRDADLRKEARRYFPHSNVRAYQADLANRLYETLRTSRLVVIEAPTGLGKRADQKLIPPDRGSWREF